MKFDLYEFVYRGGKFSPAGVGSWHVRLAQTVIMPSGATQITLDEAMTPDQAAAAGFPLSKVLADINADALTQVASLTDALAESKDQHAQTISDAEALRARLDQVSAERDALDLRLASRKAGAASMSSENGPA